MSPVCLFICLLVIMKGLLVCRMCVHYELCTVLFGLSVDAGVIMRTFGLLLLQVM